jgi:site-specific DNA recombinase
LSRSSAWYCDLIVIALNKSALRTLLLLAAAHGASPSSEEAEDDLIELTIEARAQRRGRAVRLVLNPTEASAAAAQASLALINVLAQGQRWLEQLVRGEVSSLRSIAQSVSRSERHVSQVVRAAFLAPDLVEAVLQGRAPAQLTLRQIMKQLPYDWSEQRRLLGFAPGATISPKFLRRQGEFALA